MVRNRKCCHLQTLSSIPTETRPVSGFKRICGAVMWGLKTVAILYELFGLEKEAEEEFLENAAFATIGDVMPLLGENRSIVKLGIARLRSTDNIGMMALMRAADIEPESITSFTIGSVLGPMFNASGRLKDAKLGVDLLLSEDQNEAEQIANELYQLNVDRKEQTVDGTEKRPLNWQKSMILTLGTVLFLQEVNESVAVS